MLKLMRTSLRRFTTSNLVAEGPPKLPFDPYTVDENDYKDVNSKIKYTTGYGIVEVEPFPRMKIMKVSKHMLHRLRNELPESLLARTYMEEKYKYYMELTHETTDILELEQKLDTDSIEMFIAEIAKETLYLDYIVAECIWEDEFTEEDIQELKLDRTPMEETIRSAKKLPETPTAVLENR